MSIPDIPRMYTAMAEWFACIIYMLVLKKRFNKTKSMVLALLFLALFCLLHYVAGKLPLALWIPGMFAAILLIYLCIYSICNVNASQTLYWVARAFVLAEFAASIEWQFHYYLNQVANINQSKIIETIFLFVVYFFVFSSFLILERRYLRSNINVAITTRDLIAAFVISMSIFLISNISFISKNTPLSGRFATEVFYIRTLVNACGLILFFAQQEQRLWLHAKIELNEMQTLFSKQYEQYCLSKESIDLLNMKYHDLKHFIALMVTEDNIEKRSKYIKQMEQEIKLYEAQNKTGNPVLDIILTSKSMFCLKNGINFTCVADGKIIDFIDVMDICSIFGNALDNAIESVKDLDTLEKRIIKVAIFKKEKLVLIRFENYLEKDLKFEGGFPLSTKINRNEHGYGIKSIKKIISKYNGTMRINAENNWFCLYLLIPFKEKT
jgi:hypothetical protein